MVEPAFETELDLGAESISWLLPFGETNLQPSPAGSQLDAVVPQRQVQDRSPSRNRKRGGRHRRRNLAAAAVDVAAVDAAATEATASAGPLASTSASTSESSSALIDAIRELYQERLRPLGQYIIRLMEERSGIRRSISELRRLAEQTPGVRVETLHEKAGTYFYLEGVDDDFVDPKPQDDPYPAELWQELRGLVGEHSAEWSASGLAKSRYGCAKMLRRILRVPYAHKLGEMYHIVLLAEERQIFGYRGGMIVPYSDSEQCEKYSRARQTQGLTRHGLPVANWREFVPLLKDLLQSLPLCTLPAMKSAFRARCNFELSEIVLGHVKLSDVFRDPRLENVCRLEMRDREMFVRNTDDASLDVPSLWDPRLLRSARKAGGPARFRSSGPTFLSEAEVPCTSDSSGSEEECLTACLSVPIQPALEAPADHTIWVRGRPVKVAQDALHRGPPARATRTAPARLSLANRIEMSSEAERLGRDLSTWRMISRRPRVGSPEAGLGLPPLGGRSAAGSRLLSLDLWEGPGGIGG